ncbi:endonuclease I family protein [Pantoea ananatis]|uniref:endonuclease I family protein n=1 Tax=Pantoea ananas TaxID=553 RepID=UPI0039B90A3C
MALRRCHRRRRHRRRRGDRRHRRDGHETIKGHTVYPYSSSSGTDTWAILEIADEDPNNSQRVLDAYRNRSYAKGTDRAGSGSGLKYNREHSWPNSLGFGTATGNKGLPYAPYTDTHMLYLTDATWNADRGNKPYAKCDSNCGERATEANAGFGGGSGRYPGNSNWVRTPDGNSGTFEVWDHRKGDMARAVMYMAIRYEGGVDAKTGQSEPDLELTDDRSKIVKTSSSPAYMGLLSTLIAWSQQDPPDDAERARNEVIYSFQGNRNPFIDHPEWATSSLFTSAKPPARVAAAAVRVAPLRPTRGRRRPAGLPAVGACRNP